MLSMVNIENCNNLSRKIKNKGEEHSRDYAEQVLINALK